MDETDRQTQAFRQKDIGNQVFRYIKRQTQAFRQTDIGNQVFRYIKRQRLTDRQAMNGIGEEVMIG